MDINLVFNSGHLNIPCILGRPLSNVYNGFVLQNAGDLTASATYYLALSV
jgi:hypothetical protein